MSYPPAAGRAGVPGSPGSAASAAPATADEARGDGHRDVRITGRPDAGDDRSTDDVDPRLLDVVLGVGMALAVAVVIAADLEGDDRAGPAAYLFAAGFGVLMLARRRATRTVLVLTVLGIFAYYALGFTPIGIALPAVAALYSTAEAGRTSWAVGAGGVLIAVAAYFRISEGLPTAYLISYDLITNVALVAAAIALGTSVRLRREARTRQRRVTELTAEAQARAADERLQAERLRIARDLHDVVGHTMSVISVHSSVAAEAVGRDDGAALRAVEHVRDATSSTMRELRATVRVLRSPMTADLARTAAGLAGLSDLVQVARDAGVQVSTEIDVGPGALDSAIDAAAYRIVQEALTNVIKHSGARRASVRALATEGRLQLTVTDDGNGRAPSQEHSNGLRSVSSSGQGIAGMRERAVLLGGELTAGGRPGGGFEVRAKLPARLSP